MRRQSVAQSRPTGPTTSRSKFFFARFHQTFYFIFSIREPRFECIEITGGKNWKQKNSKNLRSRDAREHLCMRARDSEWFFVV